VSTLLHATVYVFLHNLLNVQVQIANKMGLQKYFVELVLSSQSVTQKQINIQDFTI
jgi:hypothetical protein